MKKFFKTLMKILLILAALFGVFIIVLLLIPDKMLESSSESSDAGLESASEYRNESANNVYSINTNDTGDKSATVMVYIVGSDLESDGGCASDDIEEMLGARLSDEVNVVIQTGGARYWQNPQISGDSCQRFSIQDGELRLEQDLGLLNTGDPETLADFISWTASHFAADRYGLILWDHGGGTMGGFGSDEFFDDDGLELQEMQQALSDGGVHMDFVGYDACLMGTVEVAYMLEPYADYLIASEEVEPGTGWYYTEWLTMLGNNPGTSTEALGQKIVDDYVNGPDVYDTCDYTMAIIRLSEVPEFYHTLCSYMSQSRVAIRNDSYDTFAIARSGTRSYGDGNFEQVDIADYIERADEEGGKAVTDMLQNVIAYADSNLEGSNGLSMYFPYTYPDYYEGTVNILEAIGMQNQDYLGFFDDFVNIMVYGQEEAGNYLSPLETMTGYESGEEGVSYEDTSWYDPGIGAQYAGTLQTLDTGELYLKEKNGGYVLSLSDEEWQIITDVELQVYLDDGEGYLDLGSDNVAEWDDDGDLKVDFDYTWVALNGQIVPFYAEQQGTRVDGSWYTYGYVPAELDGNNIEIILYWDDEHANGYVTGYRNASESEGPSVYGRNLKKFKEGDKILIYCDYYTYDGNYDSSYYLGDSIVYSASKGLSVSYEYVDESYDTMFWCRLLDIYRNEYWTETLYIS
ncbi:MAG: clostripain-related cysteine peptidase [Suilimivivens sp.]